MNADGGLRTKILYLMSGQQADNGITAFECMASSIRFFSFSFGEVPQVYHRALGGNKKAATPIKLTSALRFKDMVANGRQVGKIGAAQI
jgi:hypothetical protein